MAKLKKKDFIQIEYTGKTEEGIVFDTTSREVATANELEQGNTKFGPMIVCIGEGQLLPGLDKSLEGREPGRSYEIKVPADMAFGKKDAKHVQLVNTNKFTKQGITPVPGLQVNVDSMMGIVKTVTGGRTLVDFNHPLAGKDLVYDVKVVKYIDDDREKADAYLQMMFGNAIEEVRLEEGKLHVKSKIKVPDEVKAKLKDKLAELIDSVKSVVFTTSA